MKVQAIVLLLVTAVSAGWECRNHNEKFRTDKAVIPKQGDAHFNFSYCPGDNGCCTDGNSYVICKNLCVAPNACSSSC